MRGFSFLDWFGKPAWMWLGFLAIVALLLLLDLGERMLGLLRGFEPIAVFGLDDVTATFETITSRFASDPTAAKAAALDAVARVKRAKRYPALLVEACCVIAAIDGEFDVEERAATKRICEVLGLDPASYGLG